MHNTQGETREMGPAAVLQERAAALRSGAQELDQRIRELCRERPVTMLLGAVTAGFVIGRLLVRRR